MRIIHEIVECEIGYLTIHEKFMDCYSDDGLFKPHC